ncbi:hypothetical protein K435DRAFT_960381 [Dendrothele bispora CBS 962.96]|uniref:RING-type E3 ubiquitin transferase n=1 Tax=Dendrothele bispora (strain CBS 962.96) TaxID=1314807 RepID=A0A4S8MWE8_DENBC|nr:hypothetical protein K435DRAFT_960381 [Dendrothele bispora CBS 962.96]
MPLNHLVRRTSQAVLNSVTSHRIAVYALLSTVAVVAAILNALKNHSNFYSVAIYLSKSSRSVLVLANYSFLLALLGGHIVQKIFFGSLRPNEVERLYDRLWFFITESLLAFTIFRDEFDISFALMFGFLLFVKSFHWLASDRIEWMDQRPYPGPPLLFHVRMTVLFSVLWMTDVLMFLVAVESTLANGVGGMVLFASEYGILMASVSNTIAKYTLSSYDFYRAGRRGGENAPPWENKSMWVFYIELVTDFLKLTTYLLFFTIIITFYGLPLNIVRDVYITARSFITRLRALHRYQTATRNMDQRYPNATEEEMVAMSDRTCIICREEMTVNNPRPAADAAQAPVVTEGPNMTPKKLPCGHIFHFHCLRAWLERQQSCPTCRRTVLEEDNQGRRPPRPAPAGGAPQAQGPPLPQPNPFVQLGARDGQAGNNAAGIVGRFFGVQQQPHIAAIVRQGPGNAAPNVHLNGQNGVVIQYNIQYQLPGGQGQNPQGQNPQGAEQAPQPLQPAPRFDGFQGPGGVWQPWPQEAPEIGNEAQNAAPVPTDSQGSRESGAENITQDSVNDSMEQAPDSTQTLDPREAAALAAARRMGVRNDSSSVRDSSSASSSSTTSSASIASSSTSSDSRIQPSSSSADHGASTQRLDIPALIPLFNVDLGGTRTDLAPRVNPSPSNVPRGSMTTSTMLGSRDSTNDRETHTQASIPLPPSLTEEQLARLDRLTREAIDERLRVLEGVSTAVYHCIDELMRMRSALPERDTADSTVEVPQNPEEVRGEVRNTEETP